MSKIAIVTDSSAFLPDELVKQYQMRVVPQILLWGTETYLDNVNITPSEFFKRLQEDPVHPTTTQPNPEEFLTIFEELAPEYEGIVAILISSELSGTVSSARTAAEQFQRIPVRVVDSRSTSMGLGLAVITAAQLAAEGATIDEVEAAAREVCAKVKVMFVVDTLEFLHKGGRIGGASRLLGTALGLKPLLHLNEGRVDALEKVRTKRKAVDRMLELAQELADGKPVRASIIHAGVPEEGEALRSRVEKTFSCTELHLAGLSPVIATHAGPGTLGIAICQD
jgi:DegV family protein with EDD domain